MKKFLFVQSSPEILMLLVQIGGKMILLELDSLISLARYSQIIDKPTYIVNNSMSCIDLIFCTNTNVISKHVVDVSVFESQYYEIAYSSHHLMSAKYRITARQTLKILPKQCPVLIGIKHLKIF